MSFYDTGIYLGNQSVHQESRGGKGDSCFAFQKAEIFGILCFAQVLRNFRNELMREYLRQYSLVFTHKDVRDTKKGLLEIALEHGFLSHEVFTGILWCNVKLIPCESASSGASDCHSIF